MQYFKKAVNTIKNVEFFGENNLFQRLNNSKFGIFHSNIKSMNIPTDDFKLSIITIIGNESSGKSSLISNILKCDIFPINRNRCTKCPVKIELVNSDTEQYLISFQGNSYKVHNKEDIIKKVSDIMNKIDDIIEDELHIIFCNPNVITSTYYDLPGIIEYPDNLRQKSKAIVNKYIIQENTLVICVIPASTPRLTSNQALGLIIDAKKTKDCIIALSMIDLLHDDDIGVFINRILMKSDEINQLDIYNVIGLSNNTKIDENKWFSDNILAYITNEKVRKQIIEKITLENLLKSVDSMYNNFIELNWKGKAIETAESKILRLNEEYKEIGDEKLDIVEVYKYVKENMKFSDIFMIKEHTLLNVPSIRGLYSNDDNYLRCDEDIKLCIDNYNNLKKIIKDYIMLNLDVIYGSSNQFKLERFTLMKKFIFTSYCNIIDRELEHIDIWFNTSIEKFKYDIYTSDDLTKLNYLVNINFKRYILKKLIEFEIVDQELLKEDDLWINKRIALKEEIKKYNNCKSVIVNL